MGAEFVSVPREFGALHIGILLFIAAASAGLFFAMKRLSSKALLRLLFALGVAAIAAEVWKQWFVVKYVYDGVPSSWFFPWQLCSMAMYCSAVVMFLKGKAQNTVLVFLASFSLVAAVAALLFPGDMLRPQIALFCHSFTYHFIMVIESLAAVILLSRREKARFLPAMLLFLCMAAVAEVINLISHAIINNIHTEANMFYITPYYPSTQPIFHWIAVKFGIFTEIVVYLGVIILAAFGVYKAEYALIAKRRASGKPTDNSIL